MGTKGPVNAQNINHGGFTPVEPNNSSSTEVPINFGYALPSWEEWMSNWPLAMRTVHSYQKGLHLPPIHAYGRLTPTPHFLNPQQYNAALLATMAQQQYCFGSYTDNYPTPPNYYQQQQYYSNVPEEPSSMDHSNGSECNNQSAAGSSSSYNYQNIPSPPSYYSHHNINRQNCGQPTYPYSSFVSHDSTSSSAGDDGTFIDVDSLSSSEDDEFNPVIIRVVGSPMPESRDSNDSFTTTPDSSEKQDRENLLKILAGVDSEEEAEKRKVATEVLCSKFAPQKISPPVQNIQIGDCILTKENARAAVSTNNTVIGKQTQNHTAKKTLKESVRNTENKNDRKKERNQMMTKSSEEGQRSKETLYPNEKTSDSLMTTENNSNNNDDVHSKSIQQILITKDSSFNERFRSTLKNTFEAHWKKNMVKSKCGNEMGISSGADNEKDPLTIVEENRNNVDKNGENSSHQGEPMEVDEQSVTDLVKEKNGKKVQAGIPRSEVSSKQLEQKSQETITKPNPIPLLVIKKQGDSYVSVNGKHRLPATIKRPVYNRPVNIFEPKPLMKNTSDSIVPKM